MAKIRELEKNMIDNEKLEKAEVKLEKNLSKDELEKRMKEQEEEKKRNLKNIEKDK